MSSNKHVSSSPAKGSKSLNFSVYGLHCFSFFALCLFFSYIEYPPDTMRIHLGMRNTKNSTVVNTANKMAAPISSLDTPTIISILISIFVPILIPIFIPAIYKRSLSVPSVLYLICRSNHLMCPVHYPPNCFNLLIDRTCRTLFHPLHIIFERIQQIGRASCRERV